MAANDKQATLEPIQFDDKSGLAVFLQFFGIIVWCAGAVCVVFAVLAYRGIGSFSEMFDMILPEGLSIPTIVAIGAGVLLTGLAFLVIAEILRLLKRKVTTVYAIRGLDSMIPKTMSVEGFSMEALSEMSRTNPAGAETEAETDPENGSVTAVKKAGDGANIQITVNVGGQPVSLSPEKGPVSVVTESDVKQESAEEETAGVEEDSVSEETN